MVTVQEVEEIAKRLKADRNASATNDDIRDVYDDAFDRLSFLANHLCGDLQSK